MLTSHPTTPQRRRGLRRCGKNLQKRFNDDKKVIPPKSRPCKKGRLFYARRPLSCKGSCHVAGERVRRHTPPRKLYYYAELPFGYNQFRAEHAPPLPLRIFNPLIPFGSTSHFPLINKGQLEKSKARPWESSAVGGERVRKAA